MTAPGAGYPDFTRPNQWEATPYVYDSGTLSAARPYPITFVGGFGGIEVLSLVSDAGAGTKVTLFWYADKAGTQLLDGVALHAPANKLIRTFTYNRGPFLGVTIEKTSYGAPRAFALVVAPRDLPARSSGGVGLNVLCSGAGTNIAQGAVNALTDLSGYTVLGSGIVTIYAAALNWRSLVQSQDWNGTTFATLGAGNSGGRGANSFPIAFDGRFPVLTIVNDDPLNAFNYTLAYDT